MILKEAQKITAEIINRTTLEGYVSVNHGNTVGTYIVDSYKITVNSSFNGHTVITAYEQSIDGWKKKFEGRPAVVFDKLPKRFQEELIYSLDLLH